MKETFKLSDETFQVLINNEQRIADEYLCEPSYIYGIKNQYNRDPFPHFKKLYTAAAKAGAPVCHWRSSLNAVDARYASFHKGTEPAECVKGKIQANSKFLETYIDSISDGHLDLREIKDLEMKLDRLSESVEHLRLSLSFQRGVLENGNETRSNGNRVYSGNGYRN